LNVFLVDFQIYEFEMCIIEYFTFWFH